jgi:energy-coupling factor transport system substrate-specific component
MNIPLEARTTDGGRTHRDLRPAVSAFSVLLTLVAGVLAFLQPFMGSPAPQPATGMLIALACVAVLLVESVAARLNVRMLTLLAVLVAANAVLRLLDNLIPIPGGFSPIWVLVILSGVVFGAHTGFLCGALSLLASAILTGGVGPWLPFQMLTAGWMGMSAALLRPMANTRAEPVALAAFGFGWGLLYGAIMNLWSWPISSGIAEQARTAGLSVDVIVRQYVTWYLTSSLAWDLIAAIGNAVLLLLLSRAMLRILRRFQSRIRVTWGA